MRDKVLQYILRFLLGDDIPGEIVESIGYTDNPNKFDKYNVVIIPSGFFNEETYGTNSSIPQPPLKEVHGIPLLFGSSKEEWVGDTWVVHADIIASTYFMISRYEEMIHREIRDEHGRFPGKMSLPYRAGFLHRPIVDEYRALLRGWLRQSRIHVPEVKKGIRKIYLTHDVDSPTLYRSWKGMIRSIIDKRGLFRSIKGKFGRVEDDPYYTFPWLFSRDIKLCGKLGGNRCQPILFMKSGGNNRYDKPHYKLDSADIKSLISYADSNNIHIGLHCSYQAGIDPKHIEREKSELERHLGREVSFNRHHYLSIREPEDMDLVEAAGMTDDFTLGYADVSGFRLGTSYPVRWINPITRRLSPLTIHPLTIMDCTLNDEKYMGMGSEEALSYCEGIIDRVEKSGGELVLLWHNDSVQKESDSYLRSIYGKLLDRLAK